MMISYELTADEIVLANPDMAILPIGSIEQHGPHLPVMTDYTIITAAAKGVAEKTNGFLLPTLPISTCREHMGKKGSVWMEPPTFYNMITDIVMSLKTQGFKRVVILQGHGGIFILTPITRDLNAKNNPDLMVATIDLMTAYLPLMEEGILHSKVELHAGEVETSLMLYLAPETVHMDRAVDFIPKVARPMLNYGSIFRASPTGVWGEPTYATAEKGKIILEKSVETVVDSINYIFDYMQKKEKFGYSEF
jgi:creatinine amidohydrolase